ncbi:MAG: DUF262 domain-containing HNH endonuclease family protein [Cellulomonas sp.]|nr:DUF262 domain-containing HNH endonuclease family protein [Cellulomonas sp.]MCR6648534.1 DUF262 domain-containing HNH endonuclease family protein [Cellulomonas sp.]
MDLHAEKKTLRRLLGMEDEQFRIPHYQRPYSWTSEQVDDLWSDLVENAATGHFLGSLVLASENESRPQVIDGQQRLTTLMILLAVLRDACLDRGMDNDARKIQTRLLADPFAEGDARYKFKTGGVNWPVFRDFVLREPDDAKRRPLEAATELASYVRDRNKPLIANVTRLRDHLARALADRTPEQQAAWLVKFTNDLMEKVELVVISVKELADAFLLFETLNDRGLQLSAADLLKSHLLGQFARTYTSEEDVDEAASRWDEMLEDLGAGVDVSRFLRHYLMGYQQSVKKDEVFDHFKALIKARDPQWVLDELKRVARMYGEFESPGKVTHEATRQVLEDLRTLRAMTCYIALLPARRYLSEADFVEFARLAETLTFRYSTVVGLGTNDIERRYRDAAQVLIASEGRDLQRARQFLIEAMPDSQTFRAAFDKMQMGTQYLLRYTLGRIEAHLSAGAEKILKSNSLVHIEHVMPQTLTDAWRAALGPEGVERHAECLNRYGNLTLFYYGYNIPASNKPFDEKKEYYLKSDVALTRDLAEHEVWDLEAIQRRQDYLGALADEVWAIPEPVGVEGPRGPDVVARFRATLGALWPTVEPFCKDVPPSLVEAWSVELPQHLSGHADHAPAAADLSARLVALSSGWETYDVHQRAVLAGAVGYFLALDDVHPDDGAGGLVDDQAVVAAAETVLAS